MNTETIDLNLPEGIFRGNVVRYEESDRQSFREIYYHWRELCDKLIAMGGRGVNIPEVLTEGLFCIDMNAVRLTQGITGANTSFDCYREEDSTRIQVKACSVLPDLTSFGPRSVWDEIYFMDFYNEGNWDGTYNIYFIENDLIYNHRVNAEQTVRDQQQQGRRPRFSLYREIIQPLNLEPVVSGQL